MVKYSYQINAWKKCSCSKWKHIFCERLIKYFAWKNYLGQSTGGNCLGSNYLEGNYPGVIIRGAIIQTPIVRRQFFWRPLSWGQLSARQLSWGAIVLKPYKSTLYNFFFSIHKKWQIDIAKNTKKDSEPEKDIEIFLKKKKTNREKASVKDFKTFLKNKNIN